MLLDLLLDLLDLLAVEHEIRVPDGGPLFSHNGSADQKHKK